MTIISPERRLFWNTEWILDVRRYPIGSAEYDEVSLRGNEDGEHTLVIFRTDYNHVKLQVVYR